ncbi:MAG: hypothetical protein ABIO05_05225 [Ferruginibacter sp.]
MRDGRIYSVPQVIAHYAAKIDTSQANFDPLLKKKLVFTRQQKTDLTYFLYTLTVSTFLKDARYGSGKLLQMIRQGNEH